MYSCFTPPSCDPRHGRPQAPSVHLLITFGAGDCAGDDSAVELKGFEPSTTRLQIRMLCQLSYSPESKPTLSCVNARKGGSTSCREALVDRPVLRISLLLSTDLFSKYGLLHTSLF